MDSVKKKQQSLMLALFRMVVADGVVDTRELTQLYRLGIEQYGLTEEEIRDAIFTDNYAVYKPVSTAEKASVLYQLATIAAADGEIDQAEKALLVSYIKAFDFNASKAEEIADLMFGYALGGMSIDEFNTNINEI